MRITDLLKKESAFKNELIKKLVAKQKLLYIIFLSIY